MTSVAEGFEHVATLSELPPDAFMGQQFWVDEPAVDRAVIWNGFTWAGVGKPGEGGDIVTFNRDGQIELRSVDTAPNPIFAPQQGEGVVGGLTRGELEDMLGLALQEWQWKVLWQLVGSVR